MSETCEVCGLEVASVETRNLLHAGELVRYGEYRGKCIKDVSCIQRGYERSQAALAAARRECEASKADLTTLLEFVRYIICPVCAADHVRVENGIVRGHPPLDRRAAGDGNRCTASRGSILDVIRDASHARAALAAPAAGDSK